MECPICGSSELEILNSKEKSSKKKFIEEYLLKCEECGHVFKDIISAKKPWRLCFRKMHLPWCLLPEAHMLRFWILRRIMILFRSLPIRFGARRELRFMPFVRKMQTCFQRDLFWTMRIKPTMSAVIRSITTRFWMTFWSSWRTA